MKKVAIPTTKKGQETRTRILEAAAVLLKKTSYQGMTTAALSEEAGVAEGTIFRYFSSKKDIFLEMIDNTIKNVDVILIPAFEESSSKEEFIDQMSIKLTEILLRVSWLFKVAIGAISTVEDEAFRIALKASMDTVQARMQEQMQLVVERGYVNIPSESIPEFITISMGIAWYFLIDSLVLNNVAFDREAVRKVMYFHYSTV